jgi:geranylgeranyl diphosphate synthase type II
VSAGTNEFTSSALEGHLAALLSESDTPPATVHAAMRHAVLSGGKRLRPRLLLGVAKACGVQEWDRDLAWRAACAVEFIHCGSLVHDDLPAFDDARERRGVPTVVAAFGEPVAILVGTALVCRAFEILASAGSGATGRTVAMLHCLAGATGSERGVIGGQGLEGTFDATGPQYDAGFIDRYHALKTAALFRAAAEMGAIAASHPHAAAWGEIGAQLGLCFQIADDLDDVFGEPAALGKPVGVDKLKRRPNVALHRGSQPARERILELFSQVRSQVQQLAPDPHMFLDVLDAFSRHFDRASLAAG